MLDPNLERLRAMALALGPRRERLVFVGGCATGLLLTNLAAAGVHPTEDADSIIETPQATLDPLKELQADLPPALETLPP